MKYINIIIPDLENKSFNIEILDSLENHPLELKLKNIIKENNNLNYLSNTDRFPNSESLQKTLLSWNTPFEKDLLNLVL